MTDTTHATLWTVKDDEGEDLVWSQWLWDDGSQGSGWISIGHPIGDDVPEPAYSVDCPYIAKRSCIVRETARRLTREEYDALVRADEARRALEGT